MNREKKLYNGFRSQEQYQRVLDAVIDAIDYNAVGYIAVNYDADCGLIEIDNDNVIVTLYWGGIVSWYSEDSLEKPDLETLTYLDEAASDIFDAFENADYECEQERESY